MAKGRKGAARGVGTSRKVYGASPIRRDRMGGGTKRSKRRR